MYITLVFAYNFNLKTQSPRAMNNLEHLRLIKD